MAKRVSNYYRKSLVVLIVLLDSIIIEGINGYVVKQSESNREPRHAAFGNEGIGGPVPSCDSTTFCVETPYYPSDLVDVLLQSNKNIKYLATVDEPLEPYRQDSDQDGEALCNSQEMVVTPKTALGAHGHWLYVVNNKEYIQTVRVEICTPQNGPCKFIEGFADGWTSFCKQTYVFRKMVAITREGRIAPQLFKFPASCKCYVKYMGDPFARFGVTLAKQEKKRKDFLTYKNEHNQ